MKDLQELSKEKLHAYRDEARLTDLPDKLRPDHLSDDRTDAEKNRRRKGIQNATDKLQKIHKDSAKAAKAARKDKPPKPKKPDSRMTLRKASTLGSLWSEELNMSKVNGDYRIVQNDELKKLAKKWEKNEKDSKGSKIETYGSLNVKKTNEELNMEEAEIEEGMVKDANKAKMRAYVKSVGTSPKSPQGWSSGHETNAEYDKRTVRSGREKLRNEEIEIETDVEETAVDSRDMFSAILDEDEQTDDIFDSLMGSRVDDLLDAMKQDMAAGMFADAEPEEEEVEVAAEDFIAALEEAGVELTEEQIDELSNVQVDAYKQKVKVKQDAERAERAKNNPEVRADQEARRKAEEGGYAEATDYLATLGIELTEEQMEVLEASFWKPERSGFDRKGLPMKSAKAKKLANFKDYDRAADDKLKSVKMADQMTKGGK